MIRRKGVILASQNDKLVMAVLGNRDSGKSHTWNRLFGKTVRTGKRMRRLYLNKTQYVWVFLVSGSSEERHKYVEDIVGNRNPRIVLCSIQYSVDASSTIDWFSENEFFQFVHWLNPGYHDTAPIGDSLGLVERILAVPSLVGIRDGRSDAMPRVDELSNFIYSWCDGRGLLINE